MLFIMLSLTADQYIHVYNRKNNIHESGTFSIVKKKTPRIFILMKTKDCIVDLIYYTSKYLIFYTFNTCMCLHDYNTQNLTFYNDCVYLQCKESVSVYSE